MKRSSYMIGIAAILLAAAFAIPGLCAEAADATEEPADPVEYTVSFVVGDKTQTLTTSGKVITMPAWDTAIHGELPEGMAFKTWKLINTETTVDATEPYTATANAVFQPVFEPAGYKVVFKVGTQEFTDYTKDKSENKTITVPADVQAAVDVKVAGGLTMNKWVLANATEADGVFDISADATITAQFGVTATWTANGMTLMTKDIILDNAGISADLAGPSNPSIDKYIFVGWEVDGEIVSKLGSDNEIMVDYDHYVFTEDVEFVAVFEPVKFTVTLMTSAEEGAEVFQTQTVLFGDKAVEPKSDFMKWQYAVVEDEKTVYKDFDFATPVEGDLVLYGVMPEPVTVYNVTFEIEGKTPVTMKSDSITIPNVDREGYNFIMWVVKGASTSVNPLAYEYAADITFVAVYEEAAPPVPVEPGFFETPTGKCVIILGVFLAGLILYKAYPTVIAPKLKAKGGKKE